MQYSYCLKNYFSICDKIAHHEMKVDINNTVDTFEDIEILLEKQQIPSKTEKQQISPKTSARTSKSRYISRYLLFL